MKKIIQRLLPVSVFILACSILVTSCSEEKTLTEVDLENTNTINNWSQKSVELPVVGITAEAEQSNNPASNAIDNDPKSRWSGYGDPVNLILDLGSVNLVDYINIAFHKGDERTNYFQVFTSLDGSRWSLKNKKTSSGNTESLQLFDLLNTETRYIRLKCFGNSISNWNSITDIEVFGTRGDDSIEPPSNNYTSIPGTIQAEDYDSQSGTNTENTGDSGGGKNVGWIDSGDFLTYDLNVPSSGKYTVDFRVASELNSSKFDFYQGSNKLASISKASTGDWQNWVTTSKTVNLSSGNHTFKVLATGSGWNINWIKFTAGETVDPPTVDPPTVDPPKGGNDVESILGDNWKITMPYDENGNDSGNVSNPKVRNINAYEYYDLNAAASDYPNNLYVSNGEVFFVSHCGGATTKGSIYPRCELRQLDSNGDDELISFSKDQSLDVTVRAVKTPIEKPEVCMVQLKGSSGGEIVRVDFTQDDERLHLTRNEKTENEDKDVIDYDLGDRLQVRITLNSSKVRLQLNNLDNGDSYDKTWSHNDDEGYFKVGSYVQSSITFCEEKNKSSSDCTDDNRDEVGIVAVSNLTYRIN